MTVKGAPTPIQLPKNRVKTVFYVAYEVSRDNLLTLDKWEGVKGNHYIRTVLPFRSDSGEEIMGYVYIATPEKLIRGRGLSEEYREYLVTGTRIISWVI